MDLQLGEWAFKVIIARSKPRPNINETYSQFATGFAHAGANAQSSAGELIQIRRWVLSSVCTDSPQHPKGYVRQIFVL